MTTSETEATPPPPSVPTNNVDPRDAPSGPAWMPWAVAIGLCVVVAAVFQVALAPGWQDTKPFFFTLGFVYFGVSVLAVLRYRRRDELHLLKPKAGDLTFGALVAFLLFGLAFVVHALLTAPGTPRHGWIIRVYLLMGDPFADNRHLVAAGAALIGLMEELSWRGYVAPLLEERMSVLKANLVSTVLFSAAHAPAIWLLADPLGGPNPLLPLAAFGCGAAWSYLRWRMERLPPVLLSHALFTWMVVEFPLWN
jgi:membrane protease YdiL (CAAX protease family)